MTHFLRLLGDENKAHSLAAACKKFRNDQTDFRHFKLEPQSFDAIPGKPFAYWVSDALRQTFQRLPAFQSDSRTARVGLQTGDDFRFVRTWWEVEPSSDDWPGFAKGGAYSPFYADIYLVVNWSRDGYEIRNFFDRHTGKLNSRPQNTEYFRHAGLTWSDRTTRRLSPRVMPRNVVFSVKGSAGFFPECELSTLGIMNSLAFSQLISLMVGAGDAAAKSYQVGTIGQVPFPGSSQEIADLAQRAWLLKRTLDTVDETSHAFLLPSALRGRLSEYDPPAIEAEVVRINTEIDGKCFELYGFSESDRRAAMQVTHETDSSEDEEDEEDDIDLPVDDQSSTFSWAIGVVFGRFDWRLATRKSISVCELDPFDALPAKSPGMLLDQAECFHHHSGILVDDPGHRHDLPRLIEKLLERVDASVPNDVRDWLQRNFFVFHLQRYSKSRRKAPIYWPLTTVSGSYTLWIYYPSLSSQILFSAVNDFLDGPNGKLTQVSRECAELRGKGGGRTRDEEKQYEMLQIFEQELTDLRDTLLRIAPTYQPNHDDGVQITAAPLWPLFRHKPWQKVLKDTWAKLEKGDYDWTHLAMTYYPDRVREKCKTDKSFAIAHELEYLYVEPEAAPKRTRGKKKAGANE